MTDCGFGTDEAATRSPARVFGHVLDDVVVVLLAVLLILAFVPAAVFPSWSPRMAVLLAALPLGAFLLIRSAAKRDTASALLTAAIAWCWFCGLASGAARSASLGFAGRDLSSLSVTGAAALWAIGRTLTTAGRQLLERALTYATMCVVLVGIIQVLADVRTGSLALYGERPTSFFANPVYFGAISAAGLAVAVARATQSGERAPLVGAFVGGVGVALSGSRVAFVGAALLLVVHFLTRPGRRRPLLPTAFAVGGLLTGVVVDLAVGNSSSGAARLADSAGGRMEAWEYGLRSALDRPLTGHGLGRFRPAVQGRFTQGFVQQHAADDLSQAWFDAHNLVIALLVAVGVVGVGLFSAWLWKSQRLSSGPLAWFSAAIAVTWALQPASLHTMPIAMLAFGASLSVEAELRPFTRISAPLLGAGLLLGATLMFADLRLKSAADSGDLARAASVDRLFLGDPVVADLTAQIAEIRSGAANPESLAWRRKAAEREPDRPYWWSRLAISAAQLGHEEEARGAIDRALELQPTNQLALELRQAIDDRFP